MTKRIYAALVSLVAAAAVALVTVGAADASARCDAHQHPSQQHAAKSTHKRARSARQRARQARSSRRDQRRAVAYVCPMHPDVRERSRGTCPKCLMDLVAEPRDVKTGMAGAAASGRL